MPISFEPYPAWEWNIPEHFNIGVACLDAHAGTPAAGRVAMVVEDQVTGTVEATYAELAARTSKFAQLLREHDIGLGERILIRLPNSLDYPTAFLGAMKRGAVAVPTSTLLTAEEVIYLAKDSGAQVLVTDKAAWATLKDQLPPGLGIKLVLLAGPGAMEKAGRKKSGLKVLGLDTELKKIRTWGEAHLTRASDPAYLVYTSGTTGFAKGVLHAHRALLGRAPASRYWFKFAEDAVDRIVHSGKFNWTYVLGSALMDPLYRGQTVIVYEGRNDAETWPKLIAKHSASIFIGVPTIYRQIIQKTALAKADVPTLRYCMSAGEHLSDEMLQLWRERFGMDIFEAVGMSEFSYYLSQNPARPIRPGSAGFPQPGHDIRLLDPETLKPVAPGEEGMICVPESDPGLFLRYWNLPEETAKLMHDGWFFTGDYARFDDDGYIWFLGRKDDIIKSFGYRVSPYEVERVMKSHAEVADCATVGEEIGRDKLIVASYVIVQPGSKVTADELLEFGTKHLAAYKAPKVVYLATDFPRTKNGKILRRDIGPSMAIARSKAAR